MKEIKIDTRKILHLEGIVEEDGDNHLDMHYHDTEYGHHFGLSLTPEQAFVFGKEIMLAATRMRLGKGIEHEEEGNSGESVQGVSGEGIQRPRKTMLGGPLI